jgi:hypothetical protein
MVREGWTCNEQEADNRKERCRKFTFYSIPHQIGVRRPRPPKPYARCGAFYSCIRERRKLSPDAQLAAVIAGFHTLSACVVSLTEQSFPGIIVKSYGLFQQRQVTKGFPSACLHRRVSCGV